MRYRKELILHISNYSCKFRSLALLLLFVVVFWLLYLVDWQLQRAAEKESIKLNYSNNFNKPVSEFNNLATPIVTTQNYTKVLLHGSYDLQRQFLVESAAINRQRSYAVITPFKIANSKQVILVNRGLVPVTSNLAEIMLEHNQPIIGALYLHSGAPFILHEAVENDSWPKIFPAIEVKKMAKALNVSLEPFIILLDADDKSGFIRNWVLKDVYPERHIAYAIEFFIFAIIIVIFFVVVHSKREENAS